MTALGEGDALLRAWTAVLVDYLSGRLAAAGAASKCSFDGVSTARMAVPPSGGGI